MKKPYVLLMGLVLTAMFVVGCGNLKDQTFSAKVDSQAIEESTLSAEEKSLLKSAMDYAESQNESLDGKVVTDIISSEKTRQQEVKRKEEEERKRKEELQRLAKEKEEKLQNSIKVTLDGKTVSPKDTDKWQFSDIINFDLSFINTTDKDIRAFSGDTTFKDVFGKEILSIGLDYDKGVNANQTVQWKGSFEVNQFKDMDLKLRDTEFANLQFSIDMKTIIFTDGTKLEKK